jgi:hypothetical protein
MTRVIVFGVLVAAAVAGMIWWACNQGTSSETRRRGGQRPTPDEEARVVLMAFGQDWAKRFGCTEDELSGALIAGTDVALAEHISREVGVIDLRFDSVVGGAEVAATLMVTYTSTAERSTARLTLAWDDVPRSVRGDVLRGADTPVFRKWRGDS